MTSSKDHWWTRKSVERILTAAVSVWVGALVVDIVLTANTPVHGQLIAFGLLGGCITTAMFFGQRRKREAPAKPQVEMPLWVPPMQTWYMGGVLLLLAYLQVVTYGNSAGATWASAWLGFTAPFSDFVARVVPSLDAYSESLTANGYQNRVAIVRHDQAVSWVWLLLVNIYLIVWFVKRWSFTKSHVKTQSSFKIFLTALWACAIFALFYFISIHSSISYEEKPHFVWNIVHYIDSSLMFNSFILPIFFYLSFILLFACVLLILAKIINCVTQQK